MNKKLVIILFNGLFLTLEQNTMFRVPALLRKSQTSFFTKEFLNITQNKQQSVKNLYFLSQIPLAKPLEDRLFRLVCEEGVDVTVIVSESVYAKQLAMIRDLEKEGGSILCLPCVDEKLSWQHRYDKDECIEHVFLKRFEAPSTMQIALISYYQRARMALLGKSNNTTLLNETELTQRTFEQLDQEFRYVAKFNQE